MKRETRQMTYTRDYLRWCKSRQGFEVGYCGYRAWIDGYKAAMRVMKRRAANGLAALPEDKR